MAWKSTLEKCLDVARYLDSGKIIIGLCRVKSVSNVNSYMSDKREHCAMECLDGDNDDECCFDVCFGEMSGIIKNKVLNRTALILSITKGSQVDDQELKVTTNSLVKCAEHLRTMSMEAIGECGIRLYNLELTKCVLLENFNNCPNMDSECKKYMRYANPCKRSRKTWLFATKDQ